MAWTPSASALLLGSNEEGAHHGGSAPAACTFASTVGDAGWPASPDNGTGPLRPASVATGHLTEVLAALTAVIIGGAALSGGSGLYLASVVGIFIPVILNNGLV